MTEGESRKEFEAWISAPPIHASIARYPEDETKAAWPGHYHEYAVQLAWESWQEARKNKTSLISID